MRLRAWTSVGLLVACGCQHDISGTYVASDNSGVVSVQLVRTPDNHLTGQFTLAQLKPDGNVDRKSVTVNGAVDGENVSLTSAGVLGFQSITLAGTLKDGTLTLSGPEALPIVLKRSSLNDYQAQMAVLDSHSRQLLAAKAAAMSRDRAERDQREFVAEINRLVNDMQNFEQRADTDIEKKIPATERRYESITAKVRGYVDRERRLAGNPDAAVDRSGLASDAQVAAIDTGLLHSDVQLAKSSLDMDVKPLLEQTARLQAICSSGTTVSNGDCVRLSSGIPPFRGKYAALTNGLEHLEQVYLREADVQKGLIQTAEKLE